MHSANRFQLGTDLDAGTTHAEETGVPRLTVVAGACAGATEAVLDEARADHFIRRDGRVFAGTHLIIEVVDGSGLDDEARIQRALADCVEACGATLLHIHTHKFSPQGVSGVAVLAESHISVHTWPEIGYGAFDVFMCGDAEPWQAVDVLRAAFGAGDVLVKELRRGEDVVAARL
ncbi:MAG: adenosylmethionine decarboxylase [Pseudomonadota bacterium]